MFRLRTTHRFQAEETKHLIVTLPLSLFRQDATKEAEIGRGACRAGAVQEEDEENIVRRLIREKVEREVERLACDSF
jgi:hypothetical protein